MGALLDSRARHDRARTSDDDVIVVAIESIVRK